MRRFRQSGRCLKIRLWPMFEATAKKSVAETVLPPTRETHDETLPTTRREGSGTPLILETPTIRGKPAAFHAMPLACPGDCYASGYKSGLSHAPRGKCPRLVRGMFTFAATTPTMSKKPNDPQDNEIVRLYTCCFLALDALFRNRRLSSAHPWPCAR